MSSWQFACSDLAVELPLGTLRQHKEPLALRLDLGSASSWTMPEERTMAQCRTATEGVWQPQSDSTQVTAVLAGVFCFTWSAIAVRE